MANGQKLPLARNFNFTKGLHPEVTLLNYQSDIKPFLETLKSSVSGGKLLAQSKLRINVRVKNKDQVIDLKNNEFTVPNSLQVDENSLKEINQNINKLFLPSDLVRILTGLARIFKKGDLKYLYNPGNILDQFVKDETDLYWVKEWGQTQVSSELKNKEIIVETKFEEPNASKVDALFQAVLRAADEYEKLNTPLDTTDFELQTEAEDKFIDDIIPRILEKYEDYQKRILPKLSVDAKFSDAKSKIIIKITETIKDDRKNFFLPLYSGDNLAQFRKLGVYDPDRNSFLVTTRSKDSHFGIIQLVTSPNTQYKDFFEDVIKRFLENNSKKLTEEFIDPLFTEEKKKEEAEKEEVESTQTAESEGGSEIIEKITFDNPVNEETFKKKILEDVTKAIIKKFEEEFCPKYKQNFLENKDKLASNYLYEVTKELHKQVQEKVVENLEIGEEDLQRLTENPEKILYSEGNFNPEILESEWYQELIQQSINYIEGLPSPDSSYSSYFSYLFETHIQPFLIEIQQREEPPQPTQSEPEDFTSGVVPPVIPISTGSDTAKTIETQSEQINTLTQDQIRNLQYESAWMYNRAIYELYTSKGVKIEDIPQDELNNLQAGIFSYLSGMQSTEGSDFNKLFGSASSRQKALMEFYTKNSAFIEKINGGLISKFVDAEALLSIGIKDSIKLDSKVLTDNIKNTVDSLIVQYGLNQDFYAIDTTSDPDKIKVQKFSGDNPHDIIWFLDSIPPERLALIFNIPPGVLKNEDIIKQLREVLKSYAQYRGSELSLHIQNTTLQKGLTVISAEDAEKIKNGDEKTIAKHLSFTNDIRGMTKANGGEVVAGALDHKSGETDPNRAGHRKEIQKQFKTFLPLWNQLTGLEQAEVYKNFGLAIPAEYLTNGKPDKKKLEVAKLEFIQEFIFFDVSKLGDIEQIIRRNNANEKLIAELEKIKEIQNQLVREKELAQLLNDEFDTYSDPSELEEIGEYVGVDTNEMSFREKFYADDELLEGGSEEYETTAVGPGRGGLIPRFLDSKTGKKLKERFGKRFKKKVSAKEKGKKAFNKAAGEVLSKAAAATLNVIPGVGTALSAALLAIKNKKIRDAISGLIVGGLTLLIGRTLWALGSIGGAIGGVIGGVVGFVASGGAMVLPGVIIGANIGEAIIPARWASWGFVQDWLNQSPTYIRDVTNISQASSAAAAQSAGTTDLSKILSSYEGIGILAAGGFSFSIVMITIMIIFTIYSAFLIPIPIDRPTVGIGDGGPPIGGIGADSCDDPTPLSDKITKNTTSSIAGRAYDIVNKLLPGFWCYWNWNPDYDGLNATFTGPASESPDLFNEVEFDRYPYHCVYSNSFPAGCEGDYRAMDGNALYWCTWLVNHSYQNNYSLAARIMADQFRTLPGHIFMPVESIKYTDIQPGDVIFTSTEGRNGNIGHVAIIHDVGPDYIRSIDSNASARYHSFTVNTDGSIQADSIPYLGVVGFGRRL